jgi:FkbM family methyltransferase
MTRGFHALFESDAVLRMGRDAARHVTANASVRSMLRTAAHAGLLPGSVWKRLPVETTFTVDVTRSGRFRYSSLPADAIGRALFWRGASAWEAETVKVFLRLVEDAALYVDVGANTGAYVLIACAVNPRVRVMAFEPVPFIFDRLCNNVVLNGWPDRCWMRKEAVADVVGTTTFHVPSGGLPTSASLDPRGFRQTPGTLISVPVTTLDMVRAGTDKVDLIKIDVEGFEDKVLDGMPRVLEDDRPTIIVECNPDGPYRAVEATLARSGYRFFHVRDRGLVEMNRIVPDATERYRNYVCVPEGARARLSS